MPDRCQVCNAPLTTAAASRTLRWVPGAHRRRMPRTAAGLAVRFAVSSMEADHSRSIAVRIGRCPKHRFRPNVLVIITASIAAAIAVGWAFATRDAFQQTAALSVAGTFAVIAGVAAILVDRIRIVDYHGSLAWIRGYGPAYVDALPMFTQPKEPGDTDVRNHT